MDVHHQNHQQHRVRVSEYPPIFRHEVHEAIRIEFPFQRLRPAVDARRRLVEHHLPRLQNHLVLVTVMVINLQRPVLIHILVNLEYRGHSVRIQSVNVVCEPSVAVVDPDPV